MKFPFYLGDLACWWHEPDTFPADSHNQRVLVVIHGISEHSSRHLHTIRKALSYGYFVARCDLRGFGRSGGERQYVDSFDEYCEDVHTLMTWVKNRVPQAKHFLYGHSMGGCVCAHYVSLYQPQLSGLVLASPAHKVGLNMPHFLIKVAKVIKTLFPHKRFSSSGDMSTISRDQEVGKAYAQDPYSCHFKTANQGYEVVKSMGLMPQVVSHIKCPTLISHGTEDRVISFGGSYELFNSLNIKAKEFLIIPGAYHELHNEYGDYLDQVMNWLNRH